MYYILPFGPLQYNSPVHYLLPFVTWNQSRSRSETTTLIDLRCAVPGRSSSLPGAAILQHLIRPRTRLPFFLVESQQPQQQVVDPPPLPRLHRPLVADPAASSIRSPEGSSSPGSAAAVLSGASRGWIYSSRPPVARPRASIRAVVRPSSPVVAAPLRVHQAAAAESSSSSSFVFHGRCRGHLPIRPSRRPLLSRIRPRRPLLRPLAAPSVADPRPHLLRRAARHGALLCPLQSSRPRFGSSSRTGRGVSGCPPLLCHAALRQLLLRSARLQRLCMASALAHRCPLASQSYSSASIHSPFLIHNIVDVLVCCSPSFLSLPC